MAGQTQGDVAICNQARGKVGGNRITGIGTDGTTESNLCSDLYVPTRNQTLEATNWSFARIRHELTPLAEKPFGYAYAYLIPPSVIKVWHVYRSETGDDELTRWDRETNETDQPIIVADPAGNQPSVWTRSTKLVTDPSRFSPLFTSALVARLAAELAVPIAQSTTLARRPLAGS